MLLIKKKSEKEFNKAIPVKENTPVSFLKIIKANRRKGYDVKIITKKQFDKLIRA